jgi:hypothetical protein
MRSAALVLILASSTVTRCGTAARTQFFKRATCQYSRGIVAPLLTDDMNERYYITVVVYAVGTFLFRYYTTSVQC